MAVVPSSGASSSTYYPTTTYPTYTYPVYYSYPTSDPRLRFALELIEEADSLDAAKAIAAKALES